MPLPVLHDVPRASRLLLTLGWYKVVVGRDDAERRHDSLRPTRTTPSARQAEYFDGRGWYDQLNEARA
jgi:hypothetical protein